MILGIILALMTAVALAVVLWPLLRRSSPAPARAAYDAAVYRRQLEELARDAERGLIRRDEAEAARTEIARRLLAADAELGGAEKADKQAPAPASALRFRRIVAMVMIVALPVTAALVYLDRGAPGLPSQPYADRKPQGTGLSASTLAKLKAAIATLEKRLEASPKDVKLLTTLGRGYFILGRHAAAAAVYRRALAVSPKSPLINASYGEAVVFANDRTVTPQALAAFERALAAAPTDPRSRFYVGLAKAQAGDNAGALAWWLALEAEAPANAPWRARLTAMIEGAAKDARWSKGDLAKRRAEAKVEATKAAARDKEAKEKQAARGPTKKDVERARNMTPEQRLAMIRGMVDQLAARMKENPKDVEGWRRLGRSYMVLREYEKAAAAFEKAAELAPNDVPLLTEWGEALLRARGSDKQLPEPFVEVMRRIHDLDPNNAHALWYLGLAEYEAGNRGRADELWQRLLDRLPKNSRERADLAKRIESLKMKKP
jgi:cytochrome c-type biogenesis protein CcmH